MMFSLRFFIFLYTFKYLGHNLFDRLVFTDPISACFAPCGAKRASYRFRMDVGWVGMGVLQGGGGFSPPRGF